MRATFIKIRIQVTVFIIFVFGLTGNVKAQQGFGTSNPDKDAVIDLTASNKGLLLPRLALTNTSLAAPLSAHVAGMQVYNTATTGDVTPGYYNNDGTKWVRMGYANDAWNTVGNAGTVPGTNFLGTIDTQDLVLKTNNVEVMRFGDTDFNGSVIKKIRTFGNSGPLADGTGNFGDMLMISGNVWGGFYPSWTNPNGFLWKVGGNTGTSGLSLIGTQDNVGLGVITNNATRINITNTGLVNIGAGTPTEKLQVEGNLRLNGALMPNNLPGTTGQVLISAGVGVAPTWSSTASSLRVPISNLNPATAINTIDNLNFAQNWSWSTLAGGSGLSLSSSGVTTGSVFNVINSSATATNAITSITSNATLGNALQINNNGAGNNRALFINSAGTVGTTALITANSVTSGTGFELTSNNTALNSANGFFRVFNNATPSNSNGLFVRLQPNVTTTGSGLTIMNSGNVGIGTIAPGGTFDVASSSGTATSRFSNYGNTNDLFLRRAQGTIATPTAVGSGSVLGRLIGQGYDGTTFQSSSSISLETDATTAAGDMPGRIVFNTALDGTASPVERMRIDNAGNVSIGTSGISGALQVNGSFLGKIRALATGTVAADDYTILVGGAISLPSAVVANTGQVYYLVNDTNASQIVTGSFRENGANTTSIALNNTAGTKSILVQSTGSRWVVLSKS